MSTTRTAVIAIAAGIAFAAEAVAELAHHQAQPFASTGDYVIEALFAVALALGTVAWWTLRSSGAVGSGRGRTGAAIGAAGNAALTLSALATIANGADALGPVFLAGLAASLVGSMVVASAGPRGRAIGGALATGLLASFAVGTGGAAIVGLAWIAVGTLLRTHAMPRTAAPAAA